VTDVDARSRVTGFLDTSHAGRFALVGVVNTVIDLTVFGALSILGVPMLLANFVSTSAGMTFGFFAHRSYSFRSARPWHATVLSFVLATGSGLWVVQPLVIWAAGQVLGPALGESALTLVWIPKMCAIVVGLAYNFLLYRFVVFADPHEDEAAS
jgi:putative flippase GtrA